MGIKSNATIRLQHIVSEDKRYHLIGGGHTTTTRYSEYSFPYSRPASGIETVPLTCPYEGCGAQTAVRIAGVTEAQQKRKKMFGIAAVVVLVWLLDMLAVFTLSMKTTLWGIAFFTLFPLVAAVFIALAVVFSYAGKEGWDKISGHVVSVSNKVT